MTSVTSSGMTSVKFIKWAVLGFISVILVFVAFTRALNIIETGDPTLGWMHTIAGALLVVYLGYRVGE